MDFNKINSDLIYIGSCIQNIEMRNRIVSLDDDSKKILSFDVEVSNIREDEDDWLGRATVLVNVTINGEKERSSEADFFLEMQVEGEFLASKKKIDKDKFVSMLYLNGGTALYSIIRSHVQNVTSATFMDGKILLPMVNMIEVMNEKEREKEKQPK